MNTGIQQHPEWYAGLHASSSFEAFQTALHLGKHHGCPVPCPATATATITAAAGTSITSSIIATTSSSAHIAITSRLHITSTARNTTAAGQNLRTSSNTPQEIGELGGTAYAAVTSQAA